MGEDSKIEWTTHSYNPWHGCVKISPGCLHCYAETMTQRWGGNFWGPSKTTDRKLFGDKHWNEPMIWNEKAEKAGERHRVFCASMGDVFESHSQVEESRARLVRLIEKTPNLIWLLLTKRPENIIPMLDQSLDHLYRHDNHAKESSYGWLVRMGDRVWMGTSVEDQQRADERIPELLQIPAAIRFLSVEPLLGPVDLWGARYKYPDGHIGGLGNWGKPMIHWVIVGGESGPGARPMAPSWARQIRDDCVGAGVAFHFKQWGEYLPVDQSVLTLGQDAGQRPPMLREAHGNWFQKVGKKNAGRLLDGREWNEFPKVREMV